MTQKQFAAAAIVILKDYSFDMTEEFRGSKQTKFGKMSASLHVDASKVFSVYMQFETFHPNTRDEFERRFDTSEFNFNSCKWNIHRVDPNIALIALENRLEGLTYPL